MVEQDREVQFKGAGRLRVPSCLCESKFAEILWRWSPGVLSFRLQIVAPWTGGAPPTALFFSLLTPVQSLEVGGSPWIVPWTETSCIELKGRISVCVPTSKKRLF